MSGMDSTTLKSTYHLRLLSRLLRLRNPTCKREVRSARWPGQSVRVTLEEEEGQGRERRRGAEGDGEQEGQR